MAETLQKIHTDFAIWNTNGRGQVRGERPWEGFIGNFQLQVITTVVSRTTYQTWILFVWHAG